LEYLHEKRDLDFDWHQVARKSLTTGQVLVETMALSNKGDLFVVASSADSEVR
jgi:hypothetical protein